MSIDPDSDTDLLKLAARGALLPFAAGEMDGPERNWHVGLFGGDVAYSEVVEVQLEPGTFREHPAPGGLNRPWQVNSWDVPAFFAREFLRQSKILTCQWVESCAGRPTQQLWSEGSLTDRLQNVQRMFEFWQETPQDPTKVARFRSLLDRARMGVEVEQAVLAIELAMDGDGWDSFISTVNGIQDAEPSARSVLRLVDSLEDQHLVEASLPLLWARQLLEAMKNEWEPKVCICGQAFIFQQGRDVTTPRKHPTAKFCSATCAANEMNRRFRARKKVAK
jgi:hypothetical protein